MQRDPEAPATSIDAFHRGGFWLVQPTSRGHRAGIDAMMLAAVVPQDFSGRLADLGAGAGAAGFAVAARSRQARVTLVERSPEMLECARQSILLAHNAATAGRIEMLAADVTLTGERRVRAGLKDNGFDFAIMNPPFNAGTDRVSPDTLRRLAHVIDGDLFESWIRTAAAIVKPRGGLALIARPASLHAILSAMGGRFGDTRLVQIQPRAKAAAIRVILVARKGARGALSLLPPLVLHGDDGAPTARADAIANGQRGLFDD